MREFLVQKNWVNLIAALSLAVLPVFLIGGKGLTQKDARQVAAVVQVADRVAE